MNLKEFLVYKILLILQTVLNDYLLQKLPGGGPGNGNSTNTGPGKVAFPKIDTDPPAFSQEVINMLLMNVEEDRLLRTPDPFIQVGKKYSAVRRTGKQLLSILYGCRVI